MVQPPAGAPPSMKKVASSMVKAKRQDPETHIVHARQRHVRRADHHGHHPVGEPYAGGHDHAEYHDQRVHGGHGVEKLRVHILHARLEQLGANHHGHGAADKEHDQGKHQVHGADILMVGGKQPAAQSCQACGRGRRDGVRVLSA